MSANEIAKVSEQYRGRLAAILTPDQLACFEAYQQRVEVAIAQLYVIHPLAVSSTWIPTTPGRISSATPGYSSAPDGGLFNLVLIAER